jgi:hypothetical protein
MAQQETLGQFSYRVFGSTGVSLTTYWQTGSTIEAKTAGVSFSDMTLGSKLSYMNGEPVNADRVDTAWGVRSKDPRNQKTNDQ